MSKLTKSNNSWINKKWFIILTRILQILVCLYAVVIWSLLWAQKANKYLIFSIIPLCLAVSILNKNDWCIWIGEAITIAADIFLILFGKADIGMGVFIGVQVAYAAFYWRYDKSLKRSIIVTAITIGLIALLIPLSKVVMKDKFNSTIVCAMIYLPILVSNIVRAALLKNIFLAIAFGLFLLCDIFVGLPFLLPSDNPVIRFANKFNFCHVFYIPSQIMIAFASHTFQVKWNNKIAGR